jgi:hypothetical protein
MSLRRLRSQSSGFTLVEALLAFVVLGLAASAGYEVLRGIIGRYQTFRDDSVVSGSLSIATALLARDLRGAYVSVDQRQTLFFGRPSSETPGSLLDFCHFQSTQHVSEVGYFLKRSENGSWDLWRRAQDALDADPISGGRESLICRSVKAFRITFFNGSEWLDHWGWDAENHRPFEGIRGLPLAVGIELTLTSPKGYDTSARFRVPVMVSLLNQENHG